MFYSIVGVQFVNDEKRGMAVYDDSNHKIRYRAPMFRGSLLFLCLLLVSLTTATAIHARELAGALDIECSGYVHSDTDQDRSSGDADRAVPHHHGNCHGAAAFLPARGTAPNILAFLDMPAQPQDWSAMGLWIAGPDLRPPIA